MRILLAICLVVGMAASGAEALAQEKDSTACAGVNASLPPELSAWPARTASSAGTTQSGTPLALAHATDARLNPSAEMQYLFPPHQSGPTASFGGIYKVTIKQAGTYRVALGAAAWIEMVQKGAAVPSIAHGHGPACSDIRKIVDFTLEPGDYMIQISASPVAELGLLVTALP